MSAPTASQVEQALKDIQGLKPNQLVEVIKNPKDLKNTLGVVLDILTVASVFFPQVTAVEDVIELLVVFLPILKAGAALEGIHWPTPDTDPLHDAQLSHGGGDLK